MTTSSKPSSDNQGRIAQVVSWAGIKGFYRYCGPKFGPYISPAKVAQHANNLNKITKNNTQTIACEFISQFVYDLLRHEVFHPTADNPENVFQQKMFKLLRNPKGRTSFGHFLENLIGSPNGKKIIKNVINIQLLKALANLSLKIKMIDRDSDNKTELITEIIQLAAQHFKRITEITFKGTRSTDYKTFLSKFHSVNLLHKGIPSPQLKPTVRQSKDWRIIMFFKEFWNDLQKIALPNIKTDPLRNDLELPDLLIPGYGNLREVLADTLEAEMPKVLYMLFQDILLEPHTLNLMLLQGLEQLTSSDPQSKQFSLRPIPKDALQENLNEACEDLFRQLTNLFPYTLVKSGFNLPYLQINAGKALGLVIREKLMTTDLLQLINKGVMNGLSAWDSGKIDWKPAKWIKNENGEYKIVPQHAVKDNMGVTVSMPTNKSMHFEFPKNEAERLALKNKQQEYAAKIEERLIKKIYDLATGTITNLLPDLVENISKKLQNIINDFIFACFGSIGIKAKDTIANFLYLIIIQWVCLIVKKITKTVTWPIAKLFEAHFMNISKKVVQLLHMSINENLLFKITDVVRAALTQPLPANKEAV